jgi:hypothetical protein
MAAVVAATTTLVDESANTPLELVVDFVVGVLEAKRRMESGGNVAEAVLGTLVEYADATCGEAICSGVAKRID